MFAEASPLREGLLHYIDSMEQMHSLLNLQIRQHFGGPDSLPREWQGFIDAVNAAYIEFDGRREAFHGPSD